MSLYLDELKVGDRFGSRSQRMDASSIKAFAQHFDPQPFHLDEELARTTLFGGLVASGWHTAAVAMRLMLDGGFPVSGGIIGTNADLRFLAPVRAGDEVHVQCEVLEVAPSRSKPDRGTVRLRCNVVNQHGTTALRLETAIIVFRRATRSRGARTLKVRPDQRVAPPPGGSPRNVRVWGGPVTTRTRHTGADLHDLISKNQCGFCIDAVASAHRICDKLSHNDDND